MLQEGSPLLACSEEDYVNDVNNFKAQGFTSKEDFSAYKKKVLEKKLGLSSVPGMTSGLSSIGVTDADLEDDVNQPPRKRNKQGPGTVYRRVFLGCLHGISGCSLEPALRAFSGPWRSGCTSP